MPKVWVLENRVEDWTFREKIHLVQWIERRSKEFESI